MRKSQAGKVSLFFYVFINFFIILMSSSFFSIGKTLTYCLYLCLYPDLDYCSKMGSSKRSTTLSLDSLPLQVKDHSNTEVTISREPQLLANPPVGSIDYVGPCLMMALKRKLLILDLNGFLCNSIKLATGRLTRRFQTQGVPGVHQGRHHLYLERLDYHQFLEKCFQSFDVAIWTYAAEFCLGEMMSLLFTELEHSQFKFVPNQALC